MNVHRRTLALLTVLAAASVGLALTPAGSARSVKVTAEPANYADPAGDAKSAPDVSNVMLDLNEANGALTIRIDFATNEDLSNDGGVLVEIDADHNSGTGDQAGAEYVVAIFSDGMVLLKWNGSKMDLFNHQPTILVRSPTRIGVLLCSCDLGTQSFDFVVAGVRANDVDLVPDNGHASFPVQENAVSIESVFVSTKPLAPSSGKRFTLNVRGVRLEGSNEVVVPDSFGCSARLAGRALKGSGAGGCSWLVPKKARGKKLTVSVNVSYHGDTETFSQTYKVR